MRAGVSAHYAILAAKLAIFFRSANCFLDKVRAQFHISLTGVRHNDAIFSRLGREISNTVGRCMNAACFDAIAAHQQATHHIDTATRQCAIFTARNITGEGHCGRRIATKIIDQARHFAKRSSGHGRTAGRQSRHRTLRSVPSWPRCDGERLQPHRRAVLPALAAREALSLRATAAAYHTEVRAQVPQDRGFRSRFVQAPRARLASRRPRCERERQLWFALPFARDAFPRVQVVRCREWSSLGALSARNRPFRQDDRDQWSPSGALRRELSREKWQPPSFALPNDGAFAPQGDRVHVVPRHDRAFAVRHVSLVQR